MSRRDATLFFLAWKIIFIPARRHTSEFSYHIKLYEDTNSGHTHYAYVHTLNRRWNTKNETRVWWDGCVWLQVFIFIRASFVHNTHPVESANECTQVSLIQNKKYIYISIGGSISKSSKTKYNVEMWEEVQGARRKFVTNLSSPSNCFRLNEKKFQILT